VLITCLLKARWEILEEAPRVCLKSDKDDNFGIGQLAAAGYMGAGANRQTIALLFLVHSAPLEVAVLLKSPVFNQVYYCIVLFSTEEMRFSLIDHRRQLS
jgi:hypothetical protein